MVAQADPLRAIAGFAALLRDHGLKVGIAEQQAMVEAALRLEPARHARLAEAWRAIACHDARDWRRWPELYERYWQPRRQRGQVKVGGLKRPARNLPQLVQQLHDRMAADSPLGTKPADTALQPCRKGGDFGCERTRARGSPISPSLRRLRRSSTAHARDSCLS